MTASFYSLMRVLMNHQDKHESNDDTLSSLHFYPRLNYPLNNNWNFAHHFKRINIPFTNNMNDVMSWIKSSAMNQLTFRYGDFMDCYGNDPTVISHKFDAIVTCFFIDTLPIPISETIEILRNNIRRSTSVGGKWINVGPLQYHTGSTIPYSYQDIITIAKGFGFHVIKESVVEETYCGEEEAMMKPEYYRMPFTVFQFNEEDDEEEEEEEDEEEDDMIWPTVDFILKK